MPLTTPPVGSVPLFARNKITGDTYLVGPSASSIDALTDVDTSTTGPTGGSALVWDDVAQQWVPGSPAASEVEVDAVEPTGDWELWVDTSTLTPPPGVASLAIDDLTDVDTVTNPPVDGQALVYVAATGQWVPSVNVVNTSAEYLQLSGGTMASNAVISFPNEADKAKIILYGNTTTGFGLGITSGSTNIFASSTIRFRKDSITGAEWAYIDASGLGPRSNINVTFMNNFSGQCSFRVNPAMVTLSIKNLARAADSFGFSEYQISTLPTGVPAPWQTLAQHGACYIGSSVSAHYVIEVRSTGLWLKVLSDNIDNGDLDANVTITWSR